MSQLNAIATAASLSFQEVSRTFGPARAIDAVTLALEPGEVVCLLGPSGCGKSTLLRLASGVDRPTAGTIAIDEQVVAGPNSYVAPEGRNVGLVFQDFALFPHLSVLQNVTFGLRNLTSDEARRTATDLLERVDLTPFADAYPHTLSGGQQQRVALVRALAPRPGIVLMDEPFSGLDVHLRQTIQQQTRELLQDTGATCLLVTHDPIEAMQFANRIAVMHAGRLVQVATPTELYRAPQTLFVAGMFDHVSAFRCAVRQGVIETPFGSLAVPKASGGASSDGTSLDETSLDETSRDGPPLDGKSVDVGIRARDIFIADGNRPGPVELPATSSDGPRGEPQQNRVLVDARIVDMQFLGDHKAVRLAIDGLDAPLQALLPPDSPLQPGDCVEAFLDRRRIMVFPAT